MYNKKKDSGLPLTVIHCKKCLMTNQKPHSVNESKSKIGQKKQGLDFKNGVCDACIYAENKENIDWPYREEKLKEMLSKFRKNDGSYDCIVSGSGGKDSVTQAHILKYKYGMNPLTVTYSPILYTKVGWRNLRSWIYEGGFDNFLFSPNGKVTSILCRESFINLLHPIQPFKFGIKTFAAKMALKFDIKLIMYGETYAEYGSEDIDSTDSPTYSENFFVNDEDYFIAGMSINDIKKKYNWIKDVDFLPYEPIRSKDLIQKKLHVEFLGWYIKWDPQKIFYYASENVGYETDTERTDGTYGKYSAVDDKMEWLHFYLHYIKFGIGRCRLDASQEIRNGHITRDEGISLCKRFEGEYPKRYIKDCLDFMQIDENFAREVIDSFRPNHLWKKVDNQWTRLQELNEINNL